MGAKQNEKIGKKCGGEKNKCVKNTGKWGEGEEILIIKDLKNVTKKSVKSQKSMLYCLLTEKQLKKI